MCDIISALQHASIHIKSICHGAKSLQCLYIQIQIAQCKNSTKVP